MYIECWILGNFVSLRKVYKGGSKVDSLCEFNRFVLGRNRGLINILGTFFIKYLLSE